MFKLEKPLDNSLENPSEPNEGEAKEKSKWEEFTEKAGKLFRKIGKRNLVIALSVLVIGGAVWLNIALFSEGAKHKNTGGVAMDTDAVQGGATFVEGESQPTGQEEPTDDINSFFASAQVERKRSRDEAIEVLQLVVENPEALDESKSLAMAEMSQIAADIENESKIENLVVGKGFEKCVAVISGSKCSVIVKTPETLLPNQVAQIYEIVYEQSGILPVDTKVIEKIA